MSRLAAPVDPSSTQPGDVFVGRETIVPMIAVDKGTPVLVQQEGLRFHGLTEVGLGSVGQVLQARDKDIGRQVAIKRMRPDRRSPTAFLRFVQEVKTIGHLDHPNIVTIHDVGREEDGGLYFVMNYVDGESMEAVIERLRAGDAEAHAQWPFPRRLSVFRQVLHAVQFAHDRGVLHRDLKPANLMIGSHGEVRIVDWGIAKRGDGLEPPPDGQEGGSVAATATGWLVGTPRYMSPEQARGETLDPRSDVFALCLLAYEWFSLHHPLEDLQDVERILTAIQTRDFKNPMYLRAPGQPSTPPDLAWFVMGGLHKDKEQRYASVGEMLRHLDQRDRGVLKVSCAATLQKAGLLRAVSFADNHPGLALLGALAVPTGLAAAALIVACAGLGLGIAVGALL